MQHAAMHLIDDRHLQRPGNEHETAVAHHAHRPYRAVDVGHHLAALAPCLPQAPCELAIVGHQPAQLRPGARLFGAPANLEIVQSHRQLPRDVLEQQHVARNAPHQTAGRTGGDDDGRRSSHEIP